MDGGTGFPSADAQDDFSRARRSQLLAELGRRLRREPDDVALILPFDEVVEALGRVGEVELGLQTIPLDSIVGTVDRTRDFDRGFRPTTPRVRGRWQRIAAAQRRGEAFPPISVYRVGDLHFVRDGHHRVSVAKSLGREDIDAYVTQVRTRVGTDETLRLADLPLKDHERLFKERVPLPPERHARVRPSDPWDYGHLAEGVEAWGFRLMQERREYMDREEVARDAGSRRSSSRSSRRCARAGSSARPRPRRDAYMRVSAARYELLRTHDWNDEILARLRGEERRRRSLRHPLGALGRVPSAGVALAGPRREHEQQPRVALGAHLVALVRVEDRREAGAAARRCRRPPRPRPRRRRRRGARARAPRGPAAARRPGRWMAIVRDSPRDECRICG